MSVRIMILQLEIFSQYFSQNVVQETKKEEQKNRIIIDSKGLKKIEQVSHKWIYFLVRKRRIQNSCPSSTTKTKRATTIKKIARTFGL